MKYCIIVLSLLALFSCKKDGVITDSSATIKASIDTLRFDTVFTTAGSVTRTFTITNTNNQRLNISSIKLMGGNASAFKINVNGLAGPEIKDYQLLPNDSMYVFVTVNVNPNAANQPFIVSDSVQITYNGNIAKVQLQAYGQNAHFFRNVKLTGINNWNNAKPYVILGRLMVDTNAVLNLEAGTKIYIHADAPMIVHGTINAIGSKAAPIVIAGDRLDEPYKNFPAAYPGIYFSPVSKNNNLIFTEIHNSYQAMVIDGPSVNASPKVTLQQCIINNAYDLGLYCAGTYVSANNCLFSNSKKNLLIEYGGNYNFTNCTFASYSNSYIMHNDPSVSIYNFSFLSSNNTGYNLTATFKNSIFWGDLDNEVNVQKQGNTSFSVDFTNCIYKAANLTNTTFLNSLQNQNPQFDSVDVARKYYDFRTNTKPGAPGINKGIATSFAKDLDNNNRANGITDIGAYERQ